MNLTDFAPELIHLICSFLDVQDVRIFRLVCKTLGAVATSHVLSELVVFRYYRDLEMLRHFADHPDYSQHVRSLVYVCDVLNMLKGQPLSFKKFAYEKEQGDYIRWVKDPENDKIMRAPPNPSLGGLRPPPPQNSEESSSEAYKRYSHAYAQQSHVLAEELDVTLLRDIVPKFLNLKSITVTSVDYSYRGEERKLPSDDLFVSAKQCLEPPGNHQTNALLLPLMGLKTIQLRSLKLEGLRLPFLEQLQDPSRVDEMIDLCRNLTTFEIHLDVGGDFGINPFEDDARIPMAECRATVQKSGLRRLLGSMAHLEVLNVGFYPDRVNGNHPAALDDIIPEGMCWKNLRQFTFGLIGATMQDMVDFIRRHGGTLTYFCLHDLRLIQSSWLVFLEELHVLVETMSLNNMLISGTVYGQGEHGSEGEGGAPGGPFVGDRECWELGASRSSGPARKIRDYILGDSGNHPLNPYSFEETLEDILGDTSPRALYEQLANIRESALAYIGD
ncbi:hypothetical protein VMCG_06072 [Cytospora schulzeri]|uniref:F-box domain-containing protein n=1 Tax=Cytospora schulzeri TaxID=448051 RepID=A0A423WG45_9PEZI|nr:hypothetical protein VMCG_06072 [Valsa malicola]